MADNYLEKRYAEVFGSAGKARSGGLRRPALDNLLSRCGQCSGFSKDYAVHPLQVEAIAAACRSCLSCPEVNLSAAVLPGAAAVAICSPMREDEGLAIRAGMALQTMALKAAELGLGNRLEYGFDRAARQKEFGLDTPPLAIMFFGKAAGI